MNIRHKVVDIHGVYPFEDLALKSVITLYPGTKRFPLAEQVEAVPLREIAGGDPLFG